MPYFRRRPSSSQEASPKDLRGCPTLPPGPHPAKNGGAGPLETPRCASFEESAHNNPQVMPGHLHQIPLGHLQQPAQPAPARTPSLAHMREGPFDVFTPQLLQPLAARASNPTTIIPIGSFPARRLVRPTPGPPPVALRDLGP